jgi:transcription elongation GreA/GreB family factor
MERKLIIPDNEKLSNEKVIGLNDEIGLLYIDSKDGLISEDEEKVRLVTQKQIDTPENREILLGIFDDKDKVKVLPISVEDDLGKELINKKIGDTVKYTVTPGSELSAKIASIKKEQVV